MKAKENNESTISMPKIIRKKRDGKLLTKEEINYFVKGITDKSIPDYQSSALLMSIYLKGLSKEETAYLTDAMLYSGKVMDFNDVSVIDKHSTGGVGDKTSFILAPIAAACGVKVPMIAGRGLGHTGGTVDKIESISGFKTSISLKKFEQNLYKHGLVLIGQTKDIAPADKKLYALRDVTSTVESIPLITASIMSKKLSEGTSGIVMDIKTGPGAFMKTLKDARALAKSIRETGLRFNKNMMTIITDMSQPLGEAIGNGLEIIECIDVLKNRGPKDITDLSVDLAAGMILLAKKASTFEKAKEMAIESLNSGTALEKFRALIKAQGGDPSFIDNYEKFNIANKKTHIKATKDAYINSMNSEDIGIMCVDLGGGRRQACDKIDFTVGLKVFIKNGDKVKKGQTLATIYHHEDQKKLATKLKNQFLNETVIFSKSKPKDLLPLVIEKKTSWSK